MGRGVWLAGIVVACVLLRTAVNLPPPSAVLFGAQHMRMLEATHARIPQRAPTNIAGEAIPPAKPIIEKRELPHVCATHEGVADAVQCMCSA